MGWLHSRERQTRDDEPLQPIRIFTHEVILDGYVAPTGQRVTDILLRGQELAFLPAGAQPEPANWVLVDPADVLAVVPPPLRATAPATGRVELVQLLVDLGPYRVNGTAHLRPGERLDEAFRLRQPFLPLTDASVGGDERAEALPVIIVNLQASRAIARVR